MRQIRNVLILAVLFASVMHPDEDWQWLLRERWNRFAVAVMAHRDLLLTGVKNVKTRAQADRAYKELQSCDCW